MLNLHSLSQNGFVILPDVLSAEKVRELILLTEAKAQTQSGRGGVRNFLDIAEFHELANLPAVLSIAKAALGQEPFVVRGILFDKTDSTNWKVPWHQDVTIAVTQRIDVKGFGPWSIKAGITHVQPPRVVLEQMISVRIHLDDCPAANGALRVIPMTHRSGKLSQSKIDEIVANQGSVICEVAPGGALVMRPLLLHASSASTMPNHRRVVHFDYACISLDGGLEWLEQSRTAQVAS